MVRDLKVNYICVNLVRSARNSRNSRCMGANRANFTCFAGILRRSLPLVRHLKQMYNVNKWCEFRVIRGRCARIGRNLRNSLEFLLDGTIFEKLKILPVKKNF